ncbi:ABC transporter substrate-binding protein [Treponema primitia]|uniref:ABC transporter substrate-binding protein n=1 Tax=Treponema primitia TaxID=88058 RepID=UPI0005A0E2C0|nr:ABC transporter substrate-binding protein [Treponema primitia]
MVLTGCTKKESRTTDQNGAETIDKIRLGVPTDFLTEYVAYIGLSEGIFARNNLEVEITSFSAGINTIDAVTIGQIDIGSGADFAVLNRLGGSQNSPLRIFSGVCELLNNSELYTRDPSIKSPEDLAGKSMIVMLGTVGEYYNSKTFASVGVPLSSVKFLPIEGNIEGVALIQNGNAHAMYANGRAAESLKKIEGIHTIANLSTYVPSTVCITIASEQFLKEHPQAIEKFIKSTNEVYELIRSNPQKAAEIVNKGNGAPIDQILVNFEIYVATVDFDQKFYDAMESLYQWMESSGIIKYPYDLHNYVNTNSLKKVFPGQGNFK